MPRALVAVLATTLFTTAAASQNASYTFFGAGTGTPHQPQLTVSGPPQLGTTITIGLDYVNPPQICTLQFTQWQALLLYGFSNQQWAGLPLPVVFPQGFTLLVSADAAAYQATTSNGCPPSGGNAPSYTFTVPNDPGFIGFQFYNQMVLARIGSPMFIATDGGHATVGL